MGVFFVPTGLRSFCVARPGSRGCGAVVAHHLAKVRVASSNLVIRSSEVSRFSTSNRTPGGVAERRGSGLQSRAHGFESRRHLTHRGRLSGRQRAIGAAVARFPDTEEVTGSIPVSPTTRRPDRASRTRAQCAGLDPFWGHAIPLVGDVAGDGSARPPARIVPWRTP